MAAADGTGTPGANQNGPATNPAYSPGEVVTAAGPLTINAPAPKVDIDMGLLFVQRAYDLAVRQPLRDELIFDQYATERPTRLTHNGTPVRFFFTDDIPEQTTPLLENIDVDSVSYSGKTLDVTMREYGSAVTRTNLLRGTSMVAVDPDIANKVGYNAGRSIDTLAKNALTASTVTYATPAGASLTGTIATIPANVTGDTWLGTTTLQIATSMLQQENVRPFRGGQYVLLTSPVGAQHLRNERDTGGFRYIEARNNGQAGNDVWRGQIGMIEGVDIVVSNRMAAGTSLLIGAEALAKAYSNGAGYGANPSTVVSPVVDKLRRFASVGWLHLVGYSIFRGEAIVKISHATKWRPAGADNLGAAPGTPVAYAEA